MTYIFICIVCACLPVAVFMFVLILFKCIIFKSFFCVLFQLVNLSELNLHALQENALDYFEPDNTCTSRKYIDSVGSIYHSKVNSQLEIIIIVLYYDSI